MTALAVRPLSPVPEGSSAGSMTLACAASKALVGHQQRWASATVPWQSPAVHELSQQVGHAADATPMVLEGPTGTVMAAIGSARDHEVAGHALTQSMQQGLAEKLERAQQRLAPQVTMGGPQQELGACSDRRLAVGANSVSPLSHSSHGSSTHTSHSGALAAAGTGRLAPANCRGRVMPAFGAVYEYRNRAGKPVYVSNTDELPEAAYARDYQSHEGVRGLFRGPESAHGRAKVVWVGVGGGPCGDEEMAAARSAVARERAQRQRISELGGAKPYSRHAHMLA